MKGFTRLKKKENPVANTVSIDMFLNKIKKPIANTNFF